MPTPITISIAFPVQLVHAIAHEAITSERDFDAVVLGTLAAAFGPPPATPVNYEEVVTRAVERCNALPAGTAFSLNADYTGSRRLFSRDEWQVLVAKPGFRPTVFGRQFGKAVLAANLAKAKEKTGDNKQIYERL
jgi:hypothetical protein